MAVAMLAPSNELTAKPKPCGTYNGRNLYKGEKGGCYYLKTKKKIKTYVDKKHCNCK
jgi:hypothetical protein